MYTIVKANGNVVVIKKRGPIHWRSHSGNNPSDLPLPVHIFVNVWKRTLIGVWTREEIHVYARVRGERRRREGQKIIYADVERSENRFVKTAPDHPPTSN